MEHPPCGEAPIEPLISAANSILEKWERTTSDFRGQAFRCRALAIQPSIRGVQAALQYSHRCGQVLIVKGTQDVEGLLEPKLQELHGGIGKRHTANAYTSFERDGMLGKTRSLYSLPTCMQVVLQ